MQPASKTEISDPRFKTVADALAADMVSFHVPGVAIGILDGGETFSQGLGITSVENPLPVTPDTLFQIGSVTKTATATVAMSLVERGNLDLDLPLRTYIPDLQLQSEEVAAQVTMRHLLTHTAGWLGDYFDDLGRGENALDRMVGKVADLPQLVPLGELWSYNNAAFYLAGHVLERISGQPYERLIQETLLEPLGMNNTFFFAEDVISRRFAVGHLAVEDQPVVARPWAIPRAANAAGGIISTVNDMLVYAQFHLSGGLAPDGQPLISRASIERMQVPLYTADYQNQIGLSWFSHEQSGVQFVSHGGGTLGQVCHLVLAPERRFACVVLTNGSGGPVATNASQLAIEQYLGIESEEPEARDVGPGELVEYAGSYTYVMEDLNLVLEDGRLVLVHEPKGGFPLSESPPGPVLPPAPLVFVDDDVVRVTKGVQEGRTGEFLRDDEGQIDWLRFGGRARRRVRVE